jgi:FKBP-type peptidyl-prolyl cis-trans isomerase/predicted Ser/Thr protein kinase
MIRNNPRDAFLKVRFNGLTDHLAKEVRVIMNKKNRAARTRVLLLSFAVLLNLAPISALAQSLDDKVAPGKVQIPDNQKVEPFYKDWIRTDLPVYESPSGLAFQDIGKGDGDIPQKDQVVTVDYVGHLLNGTQFDSSYDRGQSFQFIINRGATIRGWEEGIASMRVGGTRRLFIPARLAYGESGAPPLIPPNSSLVFDVQLRAVSGRGSGPITVPMVSSMGQIVDPRPALQTPPKRPVMTTGLSTDAIYTTTLWLLAIIGILIMSVLGFNRSSRSKYGNQRLTWTSKGIEFGKEWESSLLGRPKREWSDLKSIDFEGDITPGAIRQWRGMQGCTLSLDFKSGGGVVFELEHMSRDEIEKLLVCAEQNADQSVLSKRAVLFERQIMAVDNDIPLSYTNIWTDALDAHFGTTHFVPLKTGSSVQNGRYEVRMQLASGGLSAVYLAQKQGEGKRVVLKESVLPLDTDERTRIKAKELFEREATILAKLDHSQIAKVIDYFVEDGRDYIVLEYIPGMSLRQVVQADPERARRHAMSWAKQIADIVYYLHELDPPIVHRDLTPDNLLIRDDGKIALIDFGASNEFVSQATGTLVGKQAYIPPEQFRGKAEPKSDIYAFGATLYFLLTGNDPIPLSTSRKADMPFELSDQLKALVESCTNLDPCERPDAQALAIRCTDMTKEPVGAGKSKAGRAA